MKSNQKVRQLTIRLSPSKQGLSFFNTLVCQVCPNFHPVFLPVNSRGDSYYFPLNSLFILFLALHSKNITPQKITRELIVCLAGFYLVAIYYTMCDLA
jgi:hypothetical protein